MKDQSRRVKALIASIVFPLLLVWVNPARADTQSSASSFSENFYKTLSNHSRGNFAFSPYSISQAFLLADLGANGDTKQEIESNIDLNATLGEVAGGNAESSSPLLVANRIWVQQGSKIEKSYLNACEEKANATPGFVDFLGDPEGAARTINHWVEDQTNKKIKNLVPPGALNSRSRLVLTNAVYFKAQWEYPFETSATKSAEFTMRPGRKIQVPFMNEHKTFNYTEDEQSQVIQLPYKGRRFALVIVLPKESAPISSIEKALSADLLLKWESALKPADVRLSLPRFKFHSDFLLNDDLKTLGVHKAFSVSDADFSGIDGVKDLYIAQVFHKAYLSVDESGTEATAATAIHMGMKAVFGGQRPIDMIVNRPCLFLIEEIKSKTILFMGRLSRP